MAAENFKVKKGLEVGTGITANSDGVNVTGIITATQFKGDGSGLTGVVGSGSGVVVKDEGSAVGTAGTINFVGTGVAATLSAGTATVTVNAGGLDNVVEDTTPELGGNLNLNSKFITGSGGINVTGVVTATTGDFVDIDVDGQTELDELNVAGISTFNDDIVFKNGSTTFMLLDASQNRLEVQDDKSIAFGTDGDVELAYSNGNDFSIAGKNGSTGDIVIGFRDASSNILKTFSAVRSTGEAKLFFNNNQKLTTTVNGIEVPDLNVTGVGTVGRLDTDGVVLGTNATTFAAKFADNAVANFGGGNDLRIQHDSASPNNSSIINHTGFFRIANFASGQTMFIDAHTHQFRDQQSHTKAKFIENSAVELYFDGTKRFETDQAGVKITGVATATSFSGSAAGLTNIPSAQLSGALPALDGSALTGITASGSGIIIKHDGSTVGTAGTINFSTNLDVSAISAGIVTVTASGTSGVSLSGSTNNTVTTVTGANALIGEANLTFDGSTLGIAAGSSDNKIQIDGTNPYIQFREGTTNKAYIQWSGSGYLQLGNEEAGEVLRLGDGESGLIWRVGSNNRTVWTSGNDGASSGLDADLLDGQEGSYYTNATNLASGTIPNGRFPATLPAISGANLTALNASEITSGTLPIARIADNAVTFAKMQDVGTGVLIGRNDGGSGDMETLSASEVRTLLNVADGATAGITTAPSNIAATWSIGGGSGSGYQFTGPGQDGSEGNPDIYLVRGQKYRFVNTTGSSHPFEFRNEANNADYTDGITGSQNGTQEFNVQHDAPAALKYRCTIHTSSMLGNIYIVGQHLANGANNRVLTATSAYGMTGEANLTFDGTTLYTVGDYMVKDPSTASYITHTFASNYAKIDIRGTNIANSNHYLIGYGAGHSEANDLHIVNTVGDLILRTTEEKVRLTNGGDLLIADSSNSVYNDSSGGGINLKANGQIVNKKQASSTSDPLVWLNDTGQTTNRTIALAQDGTERGYLGLTGTSLALGVNGGDRVLITSGGTILIGAGAIAAPKASVGGLDVSSGLYSIVMGGEANTGDGTPRANSAAKEARLCVPHYTNAEEPLGAVVSFTQSGASYLRFGGGSSIVNAATEIGFYTAANTTTTSGTEKLRITSGGEVRALLGGFDSKWGYTVDVSVSTSSWAQNTFYRVVNDNVFDNSNDTYLVWFKWSHDGSGAPWIITGNFLWTPTGANVNGASSAVFTPVQSTHNSTATISFQGVAGGNVRQGLQARADTWNPSGGTLAIKASKIGHPFT